MRRVHSLVTLTGFAALLGAVSCDSDGDGGAPGVAGSSTAGRGNGGAAGENGSAGRGGSSGSGAAAGAANGGESGGGATGVGGVGGGDGAAGTSGNGGATDLDAGDAGASESDASTPTAGDGEPCPNGDECAAGLVCVGYGNPLPNGESSACRRSCTIGAPPLDCTCAGGGYCEESVSGGDAGSSTGGCADADGGCACGEVIVNAGCADADEATTDFESGEFQGCASWRDLGDGEGWIHYQAFGGFHYDLATSLGWVMRTETMSLAEVTDFCASFSISGLSDWRVPTIDEARSLAGGCAETASGGSCPLTDSSCLTESCGISDECTSCNFSGGPYCRPDALICTTMHTSSSCPDCTTPGGNWRYGTINGNFFAAALDQELFPVCVMEDIPRAVPCRS